MNAHTTLRALTDAQLEATLDAMERELERLSDATWPAAGLRRAELEAALDQARAVSCPMHDWKLNSCAEKPELVAPLGLAPVLATEDPLIFLGSFGRPTPCGTRRPDIHLGIGVSIHFHFSPHER